MVGDVFGSGTAPAPPPSPPMVVALYARRTTGPCPLFGHRGPASRWAAPVTVTGCRLPCRSGPASARACWLGRARPAHRLLARPVRLRPGGRSTSRSPAGAGPAPGSPRRCRSACAAGHHADLRPGASGSASIFWPAPGSASPSLLSMITRGKKTAAQINLGALVGEAWPGGPGVPGQRPSARDGLARPVVVVPHSDQPPLVWRPCGAGFVATRIA